MESPKLTPGIQQSIERVMGYWYGIAHVLMLVLHLGLFFISGTMSVALLVGLAGGSPFWSILWGAVGISFEGTKIILWEIGRGLQRAIALLFVGVSLTFSGGAALLMVHEAQEKSRISNASTISITKDLEALDKTIEAQENIISTYDQSYRDYAKVVGTAQSTLDQARKERATLSASLQESGPQAANSDGSLLMFNIMADSIGMNRDVFLLGYQLILAGLLEIGALATTFKRGTSPLERLRTLLGRKGPELSPCPCGGRSQQLLRNLKGLWSVYCPACRKNTVLSPSLVKAVKMYNEGKSL